MKAASLVVAVALAAGPCLADSILKAGYYGMEDYDGLYFSISEGPGCWYHREEIHGGPALDLVKWRVSPKGGVMLRHDSATEEITRFGGWFEPTKGCRIEVIGAPGRNLRADLYTPPLKIAERLTLDGWVLIEQDKLPNFWVGPTVKLDRHVQLWYRHNLRAGGSWAAGADATILTW